MRPFILEDDAFGDVSQIAAIPRIPWCQRHLKLRLRQIGLRDGKSQQCLSWRVRTDPDLSEGTSSSHDSAGLAPEVKIGAQ